MDRNDDYNGTPRPNSWKEQSRWFDEKHGTGQNESKTVHTQVQNKTPVENEQRFVNARGEAIASSPRKKAQPSTSQEQIITRKAQEITNKEHQSTRKEQPSKKKASAGTRKAKTQPATQKSKDEVRKEYAIHQRKRRKIKIAIGFSVIFTVAFCIITVLSLTVFFGVENIDVEGNAPYSTAKIIKASGIKNGDNMWRINEKELNLSLTKKLPYISEITVKRKIPDSIVITAQKAVPSYCIKNKQGYYLLDENFKILESKSKKTKGIVILGLQPNSPADGYEFQAKLPELMEYVKEIISETEKNNFSVTKIDVSNENDISVYLSLKIRLDLGSGIQIAQKIKMAKESIEELKLKNGVNEGVMDVKIITKAFYREGSIEKAVEKGTSKTENKNATEKTDENNTEQ